MAGRRAIPNELKVLKGTDQPCRMREEVRYERVTKAPSAPKYLNGYGKKVYKITTGQLAGRGVLDVVNINTVVMYANEMGKYIEAEERLAEEGRVLVEVTKYGKKRYRNPLDKMAEEYLASALRLAVELGITPASASRVKAVVTEEKDEFDKLLEM